MLSSRWLTKKRSSCLGSDKTSGALRGPKGSALRNPARSSAPGPRSAVRFTDGGAGLFCLSLLLRPPEHGGCSGSVDGTAILVCWMDQTAGGRKDLRLACVQGGNAAAAATPHQSLRDSFPSRGSSTTLRVPCLRFLTCLLCWEKHARIPASP